MHEIVCIVNDFEVKAIQRNCKMGLVGGKSCAERNLRYMELLSKELLRMNYPLEYIIL